MSRMHQTRRLVIALGGLAALLVAGTSAVAASTLAPLRGRTTDETIARDLARMETLRDQLAGASSADMWRAAKAEALLAAARQEYQENDRTGFDIAAFAEAEALAGEMAGGAPVLTNVTVPKGAVIAGSTRLRGDLWESLESLKRHEHFACAAQLLARAEVQLLWAGNEQIDQGQCRVEQHLAEAEQLLLDARSLAAACAPAPVVVEAPVAPPAPEVVVAIPRAEELSIPRNVHFALNKHFLSPTSRSVIAGVAAILQKYRSLTMRLEGHTDSRASAAYNLVLSEKRVGAVLAEMIGHGVDPARISAAYLGKSALKATEDSEVNFARNRRVEMVFLNAEGLVIHAADQEEDLQLEGRTPLRKSPTSRVPAKKSTRRP